MKKAVSLEMDSGSVTSGSPPAEVFSTRQKYTERIKKLQDLHLKRNEARKLNHMEVVEEDKRKSLPKNYEAKKCQADWILQDHEKRCAAEAKGIDYDQAKLLEVGANEAEKWEKKKKKKNPDQGFSDYEQATVRQYNSLVKEMRPDMEEYSHEKEKLGDAFYASNTTIVHGLHKDSKKGIDRMVQDIEKQISKRQKYSRRRMHDDDTDIDYINQRNMKFNKKLERFYGEYTTEIKQNLERGTAV